jgi:hypothetical protein
MGYLDRRGNLGDQIRNCMGILKQVLEKYIEKMSVGFINFCVK